MKNNICVIGLANKYTKHIASRLARTLEMYFADVDDLIDFDVISKEETINLCGREYLEKIERKKVKQAVSFENTLVTLNHTLLNDVKNCERIDENCLVIFLKISHELYEKKLTNEKVKKLGKILALSLINERNTICESMSDIIVECDGKTLTNIIQEIKQEIIKYYGKGVKKEA